MSVRNFQTKKIERIKANDSELFAFLVCTLIVLMPYYRCLDLLVDETSF